MGEDPKLWQKKCDVSNLLRDYFKFYQMKLSKEVLDGYAEKLYKYNLYDIRDIMDALSNDAGKYFPSLSEIIPQLQARKKFKEQTDFSYKNDLVKEDKRFKQLLDELTQRVGIDGVDRYYEFWAKHVYGDHFLQAVTQQGMNAKIFLKCALFDLNEATGDPKRAVTVGRNKLARIK
jgi:hypothetical protein